MCMLASFKNVWYLLFNYGFCGPNCSYYFLYLLFIFISVFSFFYRYFLLYFYLFLCFSSFLSLFLALITSRYELWAFTKRTLYYPLYIWFINSCFIEEILTLQESRYWLHLRSRCMRLSKEKRGFITILNKDGKEIII